MSQIRERRQERGLTQSQLAARAGVSRQLVAAVETGRNVPAVDAALRLAAALSVSVEDVFGERPVPAVDDVLGGAMREDAAVRVGRVGDRLVAAELPDHGIAGDGWAKADGVVSQHELELFPDAEIAGVVVAGCDPALGVAEAMLAGLGPRSLLAVSAPTGASLAALERGAVHAAVVHDRRDRLPRPKRPVARVHLARWQVGLAAPAGTDGASLEALVGGGLPIVQRDRGARSQRAFERALAAAGLELPEPTAIASGHLAAARTAAILNGVAVTTEGAARAFGMRFVPLEEHVVEIWVAEAWFREPSIEGFLELLGRPAFTGRVAQFGGYDLTGCGTL
jgi:transcriptional regulator with XRE-family HTH domain/molybdate-binding protein